MKNNILLLCVLMIFSYTVFSQTNSFVTEYYLSQNFTPKYGISTGVDNSLCMDCDQIKSRYLVNISGITSTGNRMPSQNQLSSVPETYVLFLSTESISSSYTVPVVNYSGSPMRWEVYANIGGVGTLIYSSYDVTPTFNFSSYSGDKSIFLISKYRDEIITSINATNKELKSGLAITIQLPYCTTIDASNNIQLEGVGVFYTPNITTLDISGCSFSTTEVDDILTLLINYNKSGILFDCSNQTPSISPNASLLSQLDAIWGTVLY